MKVTDLMIGDWIVKPSGHIRTMDRAEFSNDDAWFEDIKPIPLTPEILEKNGWKETAYWHEYQDGKNTIQCCLPDMRGIINEIEIEHFECEYVHQYQHLLRLCRLDEIADNFKVQKRYDTRFDNQLCVQRHRNYFDNQG